jgi:hypothetical protein
MMKLYVSSSLSTTSGRLSTEDLADDDFRELSSSEPSRRKFAPKFEFEFAVRWRFRSAGYFPFCRDDVTSFFFDDFENWKQRYQRLWSDSIDI